jgi:tetratricopeptide (TPR) repeat protein
VAGGEGQKRGGDPHAAAARPVADRGAISPGHDSTAPYAAGAPVDAVEIGSWIGRYSVRRVVGVGGNGVVVAAHDPELGRLVAIKLVSGDDEEARARLAREAQAMARLSHPNVVTVHEVIRLGERAGIVMELVDGENLATWCQAKPRSWQEIVAAYLQAARGLAAAHRAGLVHRDFKPSNALIDRDGVVRVTDFGLVRAAGAFVRAGDGAAPAAGALDLALTRTGAVVGTPAYMAPEQHAGDAIDARADQWALGCALYEALYGHRPVAGDSYEELAAAVRTGSLRPEPSDSAVPRPIRAAVRRALSLQPADRFATMDELIAALSPARRRWRIAALAGAAAIAVVAALLIAVRGGDRVTCAGLDAPLASVWNAARSAELGARFAAAGVKFGREAASRTIARLDEYGMRWVAARTRACKRGRDGSGPTDLLDRQMRCLDRRLVEMSALTGVLVVADPSAVQSAGIAVDRLHAVDDCDDPREAVPRPADPEARAQIAAAEEDAARGWAFYTLGQCDRAMPLAHRATAVGERTGWAPLLARALVLRGECENRQNDFQASVKTFDRAAILAAQAQDDALVAEALGHRFFVLGERLGRPADALAGRKYIELALDRAGQPKRQRALWLHSLAVILLGQGKLDEALAAQLEATATWREIVPAGHLNLIDSLQTQANIQTTRGDFAASKALLDEVMAAEVAAGGPDHPRVAVVLTNVGLRAVMLGDLPEAAEHWTRATEIYRAAGISDWIALFNRGLLQASLGRLSDAHGTLSAALVAAEKTAPGDSVPVALCSTAVASVLTDLGRLEEAEPLMARGLRAARPAGPNWLRETLASAARLALARGDVAGARAHVDEAAALADSPSPSIAAVVAEVVHAEKGCRASRAAYQHVLDSAKPDSVAEITSATAGLGGCLVEAGQAGDAVSRLEPRAAWLDEVRADPGAAAPTRFVLARALVAAGGDRARARTLAESARAGFATLGKPGERRAKLVETWLARQRRVPPVGSAP